MKWFLLIMGDNYYPGACTGDWKGCFATEKEAYEQIIETNGLYKLVDDEYECHYDWYEVVDLRKWVMK